MKIAFNFSVFPNSKHNEKYYIDNPIVVDWPSPNDAGSIPAPGDYVNIYQFANDEEKKKLKKNFPDSNLLRCEVVIRWWDWIEGHPGCCITLTVWHDDKKMESEY